MEGTRHGGAGECRAGRGPAGSVPVTLRAQLPQRSGTVQGLKLPACVAARVQGSEIALGGPRVEEVQERERERDILNARCSQALVGCAAVGPRQVGSLGWPPGLTDSIEILGKPGPALVGDDRTVAGFLNKAASASWPVLTAQTL